MIPEVRCNATPSHWTSVRRTVEAISCTFNREAAAVGRRGRARHTDRGNLYVSSGAERHFVELVAGTRHTDRGNLYVSSGAERHFVELVAGTRHTDRGNLNVSSGAE